MNILSMPVDKGGCGQYRVRQPLLMIKHNTPHDCHVVDSQHDDMLAVAKNLPMTDIVICRPGSSIAKTKEWLEKASLDYGKEMGTDGRMKAKWVLDIDDNLELISPYSDHYREHGVEEFYDRVNKLWLWQDGKNGFDLKLNRERLTSYLHDMSTMDMITVTTNKLAEHARQYNKNVVVLHNSINFDRWFPLSLKPNKQLRVGWSGGISHYEDWYSIKEPLNQLLRKYRFKLVMVGSDFSGVIDKDLRYLVETYDWIPFEGHSYRMMCMQLDFAIVPLADLPFNHYKSSIKWYEMSAMGCPCVVSNVLPYSEYTRDGVNALTYSTSSQFYQAVLTLLERPVIRKKLAKNAYDWVFTHRNAKTNTKEYVEAYQSLLGGK